MPVFKEPEMNTRTRKRSSKMSANGISNGNIPSGSNRSAEDRGWLQAIVEIDEKYTSALAVCANKDSTLSHWRPLMKLIEITCHGIPWLLATIVLLLSVHRASHVEFLVNLLYGLIMDLTNIVILKVLFRRTRPAHNEMDMFATISIDNYSFPSGHASRAGLLACLFIFHVFSSISAIVVTLAWTAIVCLSRVILGRHHLIDVASGALLGLLEYLFLLYLWVPTDTCMSWLELYFSHFHL